MWLKLPAKQAKQIFTTSIYVHICISIHIYVYIYGYMRDAKQICMLQTKNRKTTTTYVFTYMSSTQIWARGSQTAGADRMATAQLGAGGADWIGGTQGPDTGSQRAPGPDTKSERAPAGRRAPGPLCRGWALSVSGPSALPILCVGAWRPLCRDPALSCSLCRGLALSRSLCRGPALFRSPPFFFDGRKERMTSENARQWLLEAWG